jgi:hypothetical protein
MEKNHKDSSEIPLLQKMGVDEYSLLYKALSVLMIIIFHKQNHTMQIILSFTFPLSKKSLNILPFQKIIVHIIIL